MSKRGNCYGEEKGSYISDVEKQIINVVPSQRIEYKLVIFMSSIVTVVGILFLVGTNSRANSYVGNILQNHVSKFLILLPNSKAPFHPKLSTNPKRCSTRMPPVSPIISSVGPEGNIYTLI
jgi:hypothetical protein